MKANSNQAVSINLKSCPFCGDSAAVVQGDDGLFAVQCRGCKASSARINGSVEIAVCWWQLRLGTSSHFGGAATKGIVTERKTAASRKNLELARLARKLKQQNTHASVEEMCQGD